MMPLLLAMCHL